MATFGQLSTDPKQAQLLPLGAPEPTGGAFSLLLTPAEFTEKSGADGSVIERIVIKPGSILATGVDLAATRSIKWNCLSFQDSDTGEQHEFSVTLDVENEHDTAKFILR